MAKLERYKKVIIITFLAVLIVSYYIYLTKRTPDSDTASTSSEVTSILSRDLDLNYPATPKGVVTYYSSIVKAIYKYDLSDDEITGFAQHARKLFDEELLSYNTYETYLDNLRNDIDAYRDADRMITDYVVEDGYGIEYLTFENQKYAKVNTVYYVKDDTGLTNSYEEYTLREDEDGNWKILYWTIASETSMED